MQVYISTPVHLSICVNMAHLSCLCFQHIQMGMGKNKCYCNTMLTYRRSIYIQQAEISTLYFGRIQSRCARGKLCVSMASHVYSKPYTQNFLLTHCLVLMWVKVHRDGSFDQTTLERAFMKNAPTFFCAENFRLREIKSVLKTKYFWSTKRRHPIRKLCFVRDFAIVC